MGRLRTGAVPFCTWPTPQQKSQGACVLWDRRRHGYHSYFRDPVAFIGEGKNPRTRRCWVNSVATSRSMGFTNGLLDDVLLVAASRRSRTCPLDVPRRERARDQSRQRQHTVAARAPTDGTETLSAAWRERETTRYAGDRTRALGRPRPGRAAPRRWGSLCSRVIDPGGALGTCGRGDER
jgi:hypothetical protein